MPEQRGTVVKAMTYDSATDIESLARIGSRPELSDHTASASGEQAHEGANRSRASNRRGVPRSQFRGQYHKYHPSRVWYCWYFLAPSTTGTVWYRLVLLVLIGPFVHAAPSEASHRVPDGDTR